MRLRKPDNGRYRHKIIQKGERVAIVTHCGYELQVFDTVDDAQIFSAYHFMDRLEVT